MDWNKRRMMEMAGIIHRSDTDDEVRLLSEVSKKQNNKLNDNLDRYYLLKLAGLLTEGDDEDAADDEGDDAGDDLFGDDGGDDDGGDDLFGGGDDGGDDTGGDDSAQKEKKDAEVERIPPEQLNAKEISQFGSSTFMDIDSEMAGLFNKHITTASFGAQELEGAPGKAMPGKIKNLDTLSGTPAKEVPDEIEEDPDMDEGLEENKWYSSRDRWLISEAIRLLNEGDDEESKKDVPEVLPEDFNMDGFVVDFINKMIPDPTHSDISDLEKDMWGRQFNMARQMILNNLTKNEKLEFEDFLQLRLKEMGTPASKELSKYLFGENEDDVSYDVGSASIPVAIGATGGGGGGM